MSAKIIMTVLCEYKTGSLTLMKVLHKLGDLGSTVVKVLCYKSEGRWFDPSWCQ